MAQNDNDQIPELTYQEVLALAPSHLNIRHWEGVVDPKGVDEAHSETVERTAPHEDSFRLFRALSSDMGTVLDVGANVGQSVRSFLAMSPALKILSLEPNLWAFKRLNRSVSSLQTVVALNLGLSDGMYERELFIPVIDGLLVTPLATEDRAELNSGAMRRWIEDMAQGRSVFVMRSAISLIQGDSLGVNASVVKIDVEGREQQCIAGLRETIRRERPIVMFEKNVYAATELLSQRYRLYAYDSVRHRLVALPPESLAYVDALPLNIIGMHEDTVSCWCERLGVQAGSE